MSIPTDDLPEFAEGGAAEVVDPGAGKRALGWVVGELPPHTWFNWLHRGTYRWLSYMANVLNGTEGDFRLVSTRATSDTEPGLSMSGAPVTKWKMVIQGRAGSGTRNRWGRVYVSDNAQGMILTVNAGWNQGTALWQLSDSTAPAVALVWDAAFGFQMWRKAASASPWNDAQWDEPASLLATGSVSAGVDLVANGDANIGGAMTSATADVTGLVEAGSLDVGASGATLHTATVTNSLSLGASASYLWSTTKTDTCYRDVRSGIVDAPANLVYTAAAGTAACTLRATGSALTIDVPLDLRPSCTITQVRVIMTSPTTEQVSLEVFRDSQNPGIASAAKASMRSGGAVSVAGGGSNATITFTPDQNSALSTSGHTATARLILDVDAYIYPQIEVTYTTNAVLSIS